MRNLEQYKVIGERKKQEGQERREKKESEKVLKREAMAAKRKERMEKISDVGKNILGRISKTVENASLIRRALPEIGKDALSDLRQGAESKIKRLSERGNEAFGKYSNKVEKARSGIRGLVDRWREGRKIKEAKKLIEKCVPIILRITENVREMSSRAQEKIRPKIETLKGLLELKAVINQGGKGRDEIRTSIGEKLAGNV